MASSGDEQLPSGATPGDENPAKPKPVLVLGRPESLSDEDVRRFADEMYAALTGEWSSKAPAASDRAEQKPE